MGLTEIQRNQEGGNNNRMLQGPLTVVNHFLGIVTDPEQDSNNTAKSDTDSRIFADWGNDGIQRITIGGKKVTSS
jgi:hypothetical protein